MPGVGGGLDERVRPSRSGRRTACRPGCVVQVVELADAGDPGQRHLGVDRAGQRVGSESGSSRPARAYICSRQVQKLPAAARWVRPRSARWKACEWRVASAGQRSSQPSAGRRSGTRRDARCAASTSMDAATPSRPSQARRQHRPACSSRARRRAPRRRQAVVVVACSAGEWETPVGLRTNSIAVGTPAAARMPGVVPGAGRRATGAPPSRPASRSREAGVEVTTARTPTPAVTVSRRPVARGRARRPAARSPSTSASSVDCVGAPGRRARRVTRDGDRVGAVRARPATRPTVARAPAQPGLLFAASTVQREGQHRVAPVGQPRRAGVVGLAGERRTASGRAARSPLATPTGASGRPAPRPCSTCSSTKRADAGQPRRVGPSAAGSRPTRPSPRPA